MGLVTAETLAPGPENGQDGGVAPRRRSAPCVGDGVAPSRRRARRVGGTGGTGGTGVDGVIDVIGTAAGPSTASTIPTTTVR